jgi:small-conductance mechanosensitive channel/CRP-like cAMP-binding protein
MKRVRWPLALSLALLAAWAVAKFALHIGDKRLDYLLAASFVSASVAIARGINILLLEVVFKRRKGREAPALLRVLLSIVIYSILFVFIFRVVLNMELSGFLATSAVVSVILGLALQDTLQNFFAGISFHIEQPFHIGDAIKVDNLVGRVESVTWRTTALRTNDNSIVIFPNSHVAKAHVEIFPYGNLNRRVLRFPAPYSVPPEKVIPLVRDAVQVMPNIASERTPVVRIGEFADSSINYELLYWVKDYMWTPDMDAKIRERIWYVYRRNDIEIPFPHRQMILPQQGATAEVQRENYEEVIRRVELFDPLTDEEREEMVRGIGRYLYAPGEVIIRRGDGGDSMFVIHHGKAEVKLASSNGDHQTVAILSDGDFFGEMALFTGEPRTADVTALEEVELLEIRKVCIEQLLVQNERLAEAFSNKIAERQARLAEHIGRTSEMEEQMMPRTILRRIRKFFRIGQSKKS